MNPKLEDVSDESNLYWIEFVLTPQARDIALPERMSRTTVDLHFYNIDYYDKNKQYCSLKIKLDYIISVRTYVK